MRERSPRRGRDPAEVMCLTGGWIMLGGVLALGLGFVTSARWVWYFRPIAVVVLIILFGAVFYAFGAMLRQKP